MWGQRAGWDEGAGSGPAAMIVTDIPAKTAGTSVTIMRRELPGTAGTGCPRRRMFLEHGLAGRRAAGLLAVTGLVALLAGCGRTAAPGAGAGAGRAAPAAGSLSLATSLSDAGGTGWAVVPMGGSAGSE